MSESIISPPTSRPEAVLECELGETSLSSSSIKPVVINMLSIKTFAF